MNRVKSYIKQFAGIMLQPVIATLLGLLVGAVFIVISKENPIAIYMNMFEKSFFNPYYLTQTPGRPRSSSAESPPRRRGGPGISTSAWRAR